MLMAENPSTGPMPLADDNGYDHELSHAVRVERFVERPTE
jgi:hypothetical protein